MNREDGVGAGAAGGIGPHPYADILQRPFAEIDELRRHAPLGIVKGRGGDDDAAGRGHLLQPGRDVDLVAEQRSVADQDVAGIDPCSERQALVGGQRLLDRGDDGLELDRRADRVGRRTELRHHRIAGDAEHPPARLFALLGDDAAAFHEALERKLLRDAGELGIAHRVD